MISRVCLELGLALGQYGNSIPGNDDVHGALEARSRELRELADPKAVDRLCVELLQLLNHGDDSDQAIAVKLLCNVIVHEYFSDKPH